MKTPAEVTAERQSQEDEARQARVDLRDVLDTEAGCRVFARLLHELGVDSPMKNETDHAPAQRGGLAAAPGCGRPSRGLPAAFGGTARHRRR